MLNSLKKWNIESDALFWYELGMKKLGKEYMKKYDQELFKLKEIFRCYVFLYYDILRLLGINIFKYKEKGKMDVFIILASSKFGIDSVDIYKNVPQKYIFNLKLYNKIIRYEYYVNTLFPYTIRSLSNININISGLDDKEYIIIDLMKKEE